MANWTYSYDLADRLATKTEDGVTTTFTYDDTNQLTGDGTSGYSYDLNGNRTMSGYDVGPNNQLLADGTWDYTYDAEGNLVEKTDAGTGDTWWYSYDHQNRLIVAEYAQVPPVGPYVVSEIGGYVYDVFGNRIEAEADADGEGGNDPVLTRFAYDGANVWADLDDSGSLTTRRIFGDEVDQLFARITDEEVGWYVADRQSSIRAITNNTDGSFIYRGRLRRLRQHRQRSERRQRRPLQVHQPGMALRAAGLLLQRPHLQCGGWPLLEPGPDGPG